MGSDSTFQFACRFPDAVVKRVDEARGSASRNAWLLEATLAVLDGQVRAADPVPSHPGGRKVMANGELDRLPTDELAWRARMFAVATSKKGGPANRPSYPSKKDAA